MSPKMFGPFAKGKDRLPSIIFQGTCSFSGGSNSDHHSTPKKNEHVGSLKFWLRFCCWKFAGWFNPLFFCFMGRSGTYSRSFSRGGRETIQQLYNLMDLVKQLLDGLNAWLITANYWNNHQSTRDYSLRGGLRIGGISISNPKIAKYVVFGKKGWPDRGR